MKCIDCGGGVPGPWWKRCEAHAMAYLRTLMGGAPAPSFIHRRFRMGERVLVRVEKDDETLASGKVARCPKGEEYVIDLDRGGRAYVNVRALSEMPTSTDLASPSAPV